jgi:hypothetical protein
MKVQQILPWSNCIVEPVNPVMASITTGVNGSAEKTPDTTGFTPA